MNERSLQIPQAFKKIGKYYEQFYASKLNNLD